MSDVKRLVASIISFLRSQLGTDSSNADTDESLEVGIQCLESAFALTAEDSDSPVDLLQLYRKHSPPVTEEVKAEAEALKNEGNTLMKAEKYAEAMQKYNNAIKLDANNSIFYCNRAAAHYYLNDNLAAINDCNTALSMNPKYGRAYGRLGLALTKLNRHQEARKAYERALQLEPDNEAYKNNLKLTDETLAQPPTATAPAGAMDLGSLLQNPALMNVATQMLSDPEMQNLMSGLLGNVAGGGAGGGVGAGVGAGGIGALLQAGQQLAQHMQQANPELVEQLRNHMSAPQPPPNPPQ